MQGLQADPGSDYRDGMKHIVPFSSLIFSIVLSSLSGCGMVDRVFSGNQDAPEAGAIAEPVPDGPLSAIKPLGGAQTAAALDQSTEAEKTAATSAPTSAAKQDLGKVVVALGSPAEQGFWLRSALVTATGKGRVVTAGGASVNVDLQPGTGAALLSLAAYRALGLGLTDLPEVTVYAN